MSDARRFYVTTEEGMDFWACEAGNAHEAALVAMKEWGLEADPGFKLLVFDAKVAKEFALALTVEPA